MSGRPRADALSIRWLVLHARLVLALKPMFVTDGQNKYLHDSDSCPLCARSMAAAYAEHSVATTEDNSVIGMLP